MNPRESPGPRFRINLRGIYPEGFNFEYLLRCLQVVA